MALLTASDVADTRDRGRRPADLATVRVFLAVLAVLLAGYMFLGRGFAHLGVPPVYVGEAVLFLGLVATGVAWTKLRLLPRPSLVVWLLLGFMVLGVARTLPYLGEHGVDALRDAVLWGYGAFALMLFVLADRPIVSGALRLYGWILPVFALWLPIAFNIFVVLSASIGPDDRGSNVPLVFFKSGDMAVHIVGSIAFLVLAAGPLGSWRSFLWRAAIVVPLLWTAFVAGATNRGGLIAVLVGLVVVAALTRHPRNWLPVVVAPGVLAITFAAPIAFAAMIPASTASPGQGSPVAGLSGAPAEDRSGGGGSPEPGTNGLVIANPGFEDGTPNAGVIVGWDLVAGSSGIVEGGFSGDASAVIVGATDSRPAAIASSNFAAEAGSDVAVSAVARAVAGNGVLEIHLDWYGQSGSRIASELLVTMETGGVTTWQLASGVTRAPEDAAHAQVRLLQTAADAVIGVDDVVATVEPARSLVINPGFELGVPNTGTIGGWELTAGSATTVEGGGYRNGNFAALQSVGGPYTSAISSNKFSIVEGDDVSVSLRMKALAGDPTLVSFLNWYDSSGTQISSLAVNDVPAAGATGWVESRRIVASPAGATGGELLIWEASGNATMGIDEVLVRAGDFIEPPPMPEGRPATLDQLIENITSIFSDVEDEGLEGTKRFRLRWWGAIVNYTVFGEHFWTGKGFGINLADVDGFQANEDRSLRAPHNSHITALARMGVPGFAIWVLLQGAFGIGLLRSTLLHRRAGDVRVAAAGAWLLAYWVAMMVNTSFDPYLEGPQGGIWFWCVFGLGLIVMRLTPKPSEA